MSTSIYRSIAASPVEAGLRRGPYGALFIIFSIHSIMSTFHGSGNQSGVRTFAQKFFGILTTWLSAFSTTQAGAYDNSHFPPFAMEIPSRGFMYVSVHPNDEEWLITEAADKDYVLLYNLKTQRLQRYDLAPNYRYTVAVFSPDGEQIAMIRRERLPGPFIEDRLEELKKSEIAIMNKDGSHFRALPIPRGIIANLTISPDGKKIAYWAAQTIRKPGSKTFVADFDVREYDLTKKTDRLFAGIFNFFEIDSINYLSNDLLLVGAFSPRSIEDSREYAKNFNYSEICQIERQQKEIPIPRFTKNENARLPTTDKKKNIYFIDYPKGIGEAITRISPNGISTSWRAPELHEQNISHLTASPGGKHVAFIYGNGSARSASSAYALGRFQISQEIWTPVVIPPAKEAAPIQVLPGL